MCLASGLSSLSSLRGVTCLSATCRSFVRAESRAKIPPQPPNKCKEIMTMDSLLLLSLACRETACLLRNFGSKRRRATSLKNTLLTSSIVPASSERGGVRQGRNAKEEKVGYLRVLLCKSESTNWSASLPSFPLQDLLSYSGAQCMIAYFSLPGRAPRS